MCSQGGLFNFENEEYVIFYLLSGQGLASTIIQPRAHLSCASVAEAGEWVGPGSVPAPLRLLR